MASLARSVNSYILYLFGFNTGMDALSLLDGLLLHEMTHALKDTLLVTEDVQPNPYGRLID
jgi:hypothetical protein